MLLVEADLGIDKVLKLYDPSVFMIVYILEKKNNIKKRQRIRIARKNLRNLF